MVPRAGVEPARPFSGKRRILSPQCLPISPSGRRLPNAHLRHSVTRAARTRNAPVLSGERNARSTGLSPSPRKKGSRSFPCISGAGKESRTLDLNLGKVALYQLSYSRIYYHTLQSPSACISKSQIIALFFSSPEAENIFLKNFLRPSTEATQQKRPRRTLLHRIGPRVFWRRGPESNRTNRICNPGHNRFATAPKNHFPPTKKGSLRFPFFGNWSGKRVSNSRPQPWQGCALPTELFPHLPKLHIIQRLLRWSVL